MSSSGTSAAPSREPTRGAWGLRRGRRGHALPRRGGGPAARCPAEAPAGARRLRDPPRRRRRAAASAADVRVIAATHAPLEQRVTAGEFRRDLFHRLECFVVHVPALRERRGRHRRDRPRAARSSSRRRWGRARCHPPRWRASPRTTGRATCASCVTSSAAPPTGRPRRPVIDANDIDARALRRDTPPPRVSS